MVLWRYLGFLTQLVSWPSFSSVIILLDTPRWMWWYHWFCWLLSASGVVCILIAHEHYSIDVLVGYIATTRIFWWYHTMANTQVDTHTPSHCCFLIVLLLLFPPLTVPHVSAQALRQASNNFLSRVWWNPIFNFLERNVQTTVPNVYSWPVPLPSSCRQRYRIVEGGRDEWGGVFTPGSVSSSCLRSEDVTVAVLWHLLAFFPRDLKRTIRAQFTILPNLEWQVHLKNKMAWHWYSSHATVLLFWGFFLALDVHHVADIVALIIFTLSNCFRSHRRLRPKYFLPL